MLTINDRDNSEINFDKIIYFLKIFWRNKLNITITTIIFLVIGYFLTTRINPIYESSVELRLGQMNRPNLYTDEIFIIESPRRTISQINAVDFTEEVQKKLSHKDSSSIVHDSLRTNLNALEDTILIKARANSATAAKNWIKLITNEIQKIHNMYLEDNLRKLKTDLTSISNDLDNQNKLINQLKAKPQDFNTRINLAIIQHNTGETLRLKAKLERSLDPSKTFNSKTVGEITVVQIPITPKKRLILMLFLFIGLSTGFLGSMTYESIKKKQDKNAKALKSF